MKIQTTHRHIQYLIILVASISLFVMNVMPAFTDEGIVQSVQEIDIAKIENKDNMKQVQENASENDASIVPVFYILVNEVIPMQR